MSPARSSARPGHTRRRAWASEIQVTLRDGRILERAEDDFLGTPTRPLSSAQLRTKFLRCAGMFAHAELLLEQLEAIATAPDVAALSLTSTKDKMLDAIYGPSVLIHSTAGKLLDYLRFRASLRLSRYQALRRVFDWSIRRPATREEIQQSLALGPVLSNAAAAYVAPVYWHAGAAALAIPPNGTIFFVNTGQRTFAVTAGHVYQAYLTEKSATAGLVSKISNMPFDLENRVIDSDTDLDLATFQITGQEVAALGKTVLTGSQRNWPPAPPWEGRGVFFAAYPNVGHILNANNEIVWGIYAANTVATEVADDVITCEFDRASMVDHLGHGLPQVGYDLSGISGSPLLTLVDNNGVLSWRLAGVIYTAPRVVGEMILARRADFILPDGALQRFSLAMTK